MSWVAALATITILKVHLRYRESVNAEIVRNSGNPAARVLLNTTMRRVR